MATPVDFLIKPQARKHVRSGNIVEKIAATAKFNLELINELSIKQKPRIQQSGLKMLGKYFEAYVDNIARSNPRKYHHIYEFDQTGSPNSRLFASSVSQDAMPKISYSFKESKVPSKSGYVFKNKAYVMEHGLPLNIKPRNSDYLVFEYKGEVYSKRAVFVANPGGTEVQGSFAELFYRFMNNEAERALIDLGFFNKIEGGIRMETNNALSSISKSGVPNVSGKASQAAAKIARRLETQ